MPNASPTAASSSIGLYGPAVMDACNQINKRLEHLKKEFPNLSFSELCKKAYLNRIDLSAHGFYVAPDVTGKFILIFKFKCVMLQVWMVTGHLIITHLVQRAQKWN